MIIRLRPWLRFACASVTFVLSAACLGGCGGETPPATPKAAPTAGPAETPPIVAASKASGATKKGTDPTANMDRDELREYRKKMREQGKTP